MKKALLLTLLAACCTYGAGRVLAQNKTIDSLTRVLKTAKEDTNKVNVLNALSQKAGWRIGNYDTATYYAQSALKLAKALRFKKGEIRGNINIGVTYQHRGDYPKALKSYFSALKICNEIGDQLGKGDVLNNIGGVYLRRGDDRKAMKNFLASLKIYKDIGVKSGIANTYLNLGTVYSHQGKDTNALKNYLAALKVFKGIGDKAGQSGTNLNIGIIYYNQGNYTDAMKKLISGFKISKEIGNKARTSIACLDIGNLKLETGDLKNAKAWLLKGLQLAKEIKSKLLIKAGFAILSDVDSASGNYKSAYENYKTYIIYRDSLKNKANTKKITQTAMQYEFDKKQLADSLQNVQVRKLAAEKLQKQKAYTGMGAGLVVLLLAFSGLIFRNNKKLSKEKQKSEGLLHNILPEEVSKDLKERGATTAHEFDHVTVLFTDFVNFTIAGEKMSPTELVEELHHCFKAFDEIIGKYHIEKIKTVGDAYLAVSGLPEPDEQHATHIVKAATEISGFMLERRQQLGDKTFEVRIGIHSGSVVAGIVGIKKFAYDIWGDTVNTASRMEQNSEPGKINISETTYEMVKDDFTCAYRGEIAAKNKGKLKMYFVEGAEGF